MTGIRKLGGFVPRLPRSPARQPTRSVPPRPRDAFERLPRQRPASPGELLERLMGVLRQQPVAPPFVGPLQLSPEARTKAKEVLSTIVQRFAEVGRTFKPNPLLAGLRG